MKYVIGWFIGLTNLAVTLYLYKLSNKNNVKCNCEIAKLNNSIAATKCYLRGQGCSSGRSTLNFNDD